MRERILKAFKKSLPVALVLLTLSSCATTQVAVHAVGNNPPLCQAQATPQTALVLWGTAWRKNQKEPVLREEIASQAITKFFNNSLCYSKVNVLKMPPGREAVSLSDADLLKYVMSTGEQYDRVITVRLEEFGPLIIFYPSPILWEGGTEVEFRVRVLNAHTSTLEADIAAHWKNSGAFFLKGTKSLPDDMQAALASVFGDATRK